MANTTVSTGALVLLATLACGKQPEAPKPPPVPPPARYLVHYDGACAPVLPGPEIWAVTGGTIKLGTAAPIPLVQLEHRWFFEARPGPVVDGDCTVSSLLGLRIDDADLDCEWRRTRECSGVITSICTWLVRGARQ